MQEVETERSKNEAEEKVDDDDSEDTTDEEGMKHDEAPKTQEIRKKEPALAMVITDAIGMKTETQEGVQDDTAEVDKNETDKALINRENAPEVRTETQRKPNNQHSKNWRLREIMMVLMLLMLLMLQVDVVMGRDNLGQGQVEQCLKNLGCRLINAEHDLDSR